MPKGMVQISRVATNSAVNNWVCFSVCFIFCLMMLVFYESTLLTETTRAVSESGRF